MDTKLETKTAFFAFVGKPNVGKSTLLNALVGHKIAIVSHRPQTTRTRITGILTEGSVQYVFLDTPGLLRAKNRLGDHMVKTIRQGVADVDAAVLVVEPTDVITKAEEEFMAWFEQKKLPALLVINKIDLLRDRTALMPQISKYCKRYDFSGIIPISAKTGDGLTELKQELSQFAVDSVHFFPDDAMTDQPERTLAAEFVRERLLFHLEDEIPHGLAVVTDEMKERNGVLRIFCTIYCERSNHKGIIIGKNGSMLKKISTEARMALEEFFETKVYLQCWFKVKENWRNREGLLRSLGFSD